MFIHVLFVCIMQLSGNVRVLASINLAILIAINNNCDVVFGFGLNIYNAGSYKCSSLFSHHLQGTVE